MTSMDGEILSLECSGREDHSDADSNKKSNPISDQTEPGTIANDIEDSMRAPQAKYVSFNSFKPCFTSVVVRPKLLSSILDTNQRFILLGVFTCIVMVIGILIVCYKSPKPTGMLFFGYLYICNEETQNVNKIDLFERL
jgi:hypothetical protein